MHTFFLLSCAVLLSALQMLMPVSAWASSSSPVRYQSFRDRDQGQPLRVHLVEVNMRDPRVSVGLAMAQGKASTVESVSSMARRNQAVAAINGSFFHGRKMDSSVGLLIKNGEIIADSGHRRTSFGIRKDGRLLMGVPQVETGLYYPEAGRFQRVSGVNQPRQYRQTIVYTPRFGLYTHTNEWGREVVVRNNRVERYAYGNTLIPRDGFVISAHGKGSEITRLYPLGTYVALKSEAREPWTQLETLITGAPHLVHQGRIHNTYFQEKLHHSLMYPNTRSAIGFTHNGKLLMLNVFPEGRNKGVTFTRLAQIMRRLGAVEAMALDGGGSSSLFVKEQGIQHSPRPVTNALIITLDETR